MQSAKRKKKKKRHPLPQAETLVIFSAENNGEQSWQTDKECG